MPTLLIPPIPTFEAFLSRPGGSALALKKATDTSIDIKTVKKVLDGTASPASAEALLADMMKAMPAAIHGAEQFDAYVRNTYPNDEEADERAIVMNRLSWQIVIYSLECTAKPTPELPANWVSPFIRCLLPLDKASVRATALARKGRFADAIEVSRTTELARYLPDACWKDIEAATTIQEYAVASAPLRMLGALYILAVAEVHAYPNSDGSRLAYCLPTEDGGKNSHPFAVSLAALQERLGIQTSEEFAEKLLLDGDKADADDQRRNLRRWRQGTVPERSLFGAMMNRVYQHLGQNAWRPDEEAPLYFGLRYMHALGRTPVARFFGSKKAFFAIYPTFYASVR